MHNPSFISNQELAGFIISLVAQSIMVSLIGIAAIRQVGGWD